MLTIIQAAGWPIWPLPCSVLGVALVIERLFSLKEHKVAQPQLTDEIIIVSRITFATQSAHTNARGKR